MNLSQLLPLRLLLLPLALLLLPLETLTTSLEQMTLRVTFSRKPSCSLLSWSR